MSNYLLISVETTMLNPEKFEPSLQPLSISDDSTNTDTDTGLDFSASEETRLGNLFTN